LDRVYPGLVTAEPSTLGTKGVRTRSSLLEHAIARFSRDGFRRTSVADIARDAGLTPAAAYAYFDSKEALFAAAVDADAAGLIEQALPHMVSGTVSGEWPSVLEALLGALKDHPLARHVLSGREPGHTERLIDIPALADLRAEIAEQLAVGQAVGVIRLDIDPKLMAGGLTNVVMALVIAVLQTGVQPVGDVADGVAALLDAALLARTPQD
jgi:AcrR family transcriptional regulator